MSSRVVAVTIEELFAAAIGADMIERIARTALEAEGIATVELDVLVTDDKAMRALNRDYAGEDATTDVLAFSLREGEVFASPDRVERLGEVIISYPTALRQAREANRDLEQEIKHLLVHGILHLLGYDHAEAAEEQAMRRREAEILALTG